MPSTVRKLLRRVVRRVSRMAMKFKGYILIAPAPNRRLPMARRSTTSDALLVMVQRLVLVWELFRAPIFARAARCRDLLVSGRTHAPIRRGRCPERLALVQMLARRLVQEQEQTRIRFRRHFLTFMDGMTRQQPQQRAVRARTVQAAVPWLFRRPSVSRVRNRAQTTVRRLILHIRARRVRELRRL